MPPQFAKKTAQRRLLGEGAAEVGTQRLHRYWPAPPPPPAFTSKLGASFKKTTRTFFTQRRIFLVVGLLLFRGTTEDHPKNNVFFGCLGKVFFSNVWFD